MGISQGNIATGSIFILNKILLNEASLKVSSKTNENIFHDYMYAMMFDYLKGL